MSVKEYDVVIIGAGPGGYEAAFTAADEHLNTAVVEKSNAPGGTCLHWGCIPTKTLLHTADLMGEFKSAKRFGLKAEAANLDLPALQKRKNQIISMQAKGLEDALKQKDIATYNGFAKLTAPDTVSVKLSDGSEQLLKAKNIIIATGSSVKSFGNIEFDGEKILSSNDILKLETLPESLIVVGAGAVGSEFASIFARFGTKVTLIEALPHILPYNDEEIAALTSAGFKRQKIKVFENHPLTSLEKTGEGVEIILKTPDGEEKKLSAAMALLSVGRKPNTSGIGLDAVGVETDRGFVKVNEFMQTSVPGIYAIGDIVPTSALAHTAYAEGRLAVAHIAGKAVAPINYDAIPFCVYAKPESAGVGLNENQAREKMGDDIIIGRFDMAANPKAAILNERAGLVKVIADKNETLIGAHIAGPIATEIIGEFALAVQNALKLSDILKTVHAHPSVYESLHSAVHNALKTKDS